MLTTLIIAGYLICWALSTAALLAEYQSIPFYVHGVWDDFGKSWARGHLGGDFLIAAVASMLPPTWLIVPFFTHGFQFGLQFGPTPPTAKRIAK